MTGVAAGLRVLDFTWFGVGPITTKYLADNGADVIKVESRRHPDGLRLAPPFAGSSGINRSQYFGNFNSSKRSITIDMTTTAGRDLVRRLIPHCDIVAESFRVGTMAVSGRRSKPSASPRTRKNESPSAPLEPCWRASTITRSAVWPSSTKLFTPSSR